MPDGSVVEVTYNTRFTAAVNGAVKLIKPDGVEVQAHDDLTVEMRTGELQAAKAEAKRQAAASTVISEGRSEKDISAGAYFADLRKGTMWSADPENNELELKLPLRGGKASSKSAKDRESQPIRLVLVMFCPWANSQNVARVPVTSWAPSPSFVRV